MNVRSGRDIPSKGKELLEHLQKHGTPIMIGTTSSSSSYPLTEDLLRRYNWRGYDIGRVEV